MRYLPCWRQIGISKDRYIELLHFCRQYAEWQREAKDLLGIRGLKSDGQPHGNGKSDPVAYAAEKRDALLSKMKIVDDCAMKVDNGRWYTVLKDNICMGKSYAHLNQADMPTSDRNAFYKRRREFFAMLNDLVK